MAKNAIARRRSGPSPTLAKAQQALAATRSRLANVRTQVRESAVPQALFHGGMVLAGASGAGAVRGLTGGDVGGVPTDIALAGLLLGLGVGMGQPAAILAASGCAAAYVGDMVEDLVADNVGELI